MHQTQVGQTSFCKISESLEAARFVLRIVRSPWNLTGTSAARCVSNFKAMRKLNVPISRFRDFTISCDNTFIGYWNGAQAISNIRRILGIGRPVRLLTVITHYIVTSHSTYRPQQTCSRPSPWRSPHSLGRREPGPLLANDGRNWKRLLTLPKLHGGHC